MGAYQYRPAVYNYLGDIVWVGKEHYVAAVDDSDDLRYYAVEKAEQVVHKALGAILSGAEMDLTWGV